jgi:DNA adenine methylase
MLAPWIISHFPKHRIYVEPFGGGASVLIRKSPAWAEVYNDLDGEIVNVFRVMQRRSEDLAVILRATPFARVEFELAHEPSEDPVEQARRAIVRSFMGHGADSLTGNRSGFRANSNHEGQGRNAAKDWVNYFPAVESFRRRLQGVIIENRDAREIMAGHDSVDTLHFVDPPYPISTRQDHKHGYRHEMTETEHVELCHFLKDLRGMVILCSYPNPIYEEILGWESAKRLAFADGALERTEVIWMNPACLDRQAQLKLF